MSDNRDEGREVSPDEVGETSVPPRGPSGPLPIPVPRRRGPGYVHRPDENSGRRMRGTMNPARDDITGESHNQIGAQFRRNFNYSQFFKSWHHMPETEIERQMNIYFNVVEFALEDVEAAKTVWLRHMAANYKKWLYKAKTKAMADFDPPCTSMADERTKGRRPYYMSEDVWELARKHWIEEEKTEKSKIMSRNRKEQKITSTVGSRSLKKLRDMKPDAPPSERWMDAHLSIKHKKWMSDPSQRVHEKLVSIETSQSQSQADPSPTTPQSQSSETEMLSQAISESLGSDHFSRSLKKSYLPGYGYLSSPYVPYGAARDDADQANIDEQMETTLVIHESMRQQQEAARRQREFEEEVTRRLAEQDRRQEELDRRAEQQEAENAFLRARLEELSALTEARNVTHRERERTRREEATAAARASSRGRGGGRKGASQSKGKKPM